MQPHTLWIGAAGLAALLIATNPGHAETPAEIPTETTNEIPAIIPAEIPEETPPATTENAPTPAPVTDDVPPQVTETEPPPPPLIHADRCLLPESLHLTIGLRVRRIELLDDHQGRPFEDSFIGSIYKIEVNQDTLTLQPFAQVTLPLGPARLGAGFGFDQLEVATQDDGGGDGDIEMKGWTAYLLASLPNNTRFTPFGELGYIRYDNGFDPLPDWYANGRRNFLLDDESASYLAGGCDLAINDHVAVNLYLRYVNIDVNGVYVFRGDDRMAEPFTFTLEHLTYGIGLQYRF